MKYLVALLVGSILAIPVNYIIGYAWENRAIHAGYYCVSGTKINPKHIKKCERVRKGESYRAVFPEYF